MTARKLLEESKTNPSATIKPPLPYLDEVKDAIFFNPVNVHYVNRSLNGQFTFRLHGYAIVESTPRSLHVPNNCLPKGAFKLKASHGNVFYLGSSFIHCPYFISDNLLAELEKETRYSDSTKKILHNMKGQNFPTVEHFLQTWLLLSHAPAEEKMTEELQKMIYAIAANPYAIELDKLRIESNNKALKQCLNEIDYLIALNENVNGYYGSLLPMHSLSYFCIQDRDAFEKDRGACTIASYPAINPTAVYELFSHEKSRINYIQEKLHLGYSVDFDTKIKPIEDAQRIVKRFVNFAYIPKESEYFIANCNKATATLLQEAANLSVQNKPTESKEEKKTAELIVGASLCAIGSNQRMFFASSQLHQNVIELFINREYKKDDAQIKRVMTSFNESQLQNLADKKDYILQILDTWPVAQRKRALEQIFDEHTPLGKIFLIKRSGMFSQPSLGHGKFKIAADKLAEINQSLLESISGRMSKGTK